MEEKRGDTVPPEEGYQGSGKEGEKLALLQQEERRPPGAQFTRSDRGVIHTPSEKTYSKRTKREKILSGQGSPHKGTLSAAA